MASADVTILTVEDRLDIAELAVRYANVIDDGAWDRLAEVFVPDAVFSITGLPDGDVLEEGIEAITAYISGGRHPLAHHITNVEARPEGEVVRVRAKILAPGRRGRVGTGDYDDEFVRTPKGWRISRKRLTIRTGT